MIQANLYTRCISRMTQNINLSWEILGPFTIAVNILAPLPRVQIPWHLPFFIVFVTIINVLQLIVIRTLREVTDTQTGHKSSLKQENWVYKSENVLLLDRVHYSFIYIYTCIHFSDQILLIAVQKIYWYTYVCIFNIWVNVRIILTYNT